MKLPCWSPNAGCTSELPSVISSFATQDIFIYCLYFQDTSLKVYIIFLKTLDCFLTFEINLWNVVWHTCINWMAAAKNIIMSFFPIVKKQSYLGQCAGFVVWHGSWWLMTCVTWRNLSPSKGVVCYRQIKSPALKSVNFWDDSTILFSSKLR